MIYTYEADTTAIRERLESGAPLVACLCTLRCHKCDDWWGDFQALSEKFPEACFVWLDVDEHPDMVADIPAVNRFPFILIQTEQLLFLESIDTTQAVFFAVLEDCLHNADSARLLLDIPEPGLKYFLLE